jgi:hypothetical protein
VGFNSTKSGLSLLRRRPTSASRLRIAPKGISRPRQKERQLSPLSWYSRIIPSHSSLVISLISHPTIAVTPNQHQRRIRHVEDIDFPTVSHPFFVEGNFQDYEDDKRKRLGDDAVRPTRARYRKLAASFLHTVCRWSCSNGFFCKRSS